MNMNSSLLLHVHLLLLLLLLVPIPTISQTCKSSCGSLPIHYPFGSGPGCGHPTFQPYLTCDETLNTLVFSTSSGSYSIQSIDYSNQIIILQDPSMSTCSHSSSSSGFALDCNAPFVFSQSNVFILLNCSPIHNDACDATNARLCSLLYSGCPALWGPDSSTCCVYAPATLGPAFDVEVEKMECGGYAGVYSLEGVEINPQGWKFGVAVKYKVGVGGVDDGGFRSVCSECERSGGVCGFSGERAEAAFACNCAGGMNTTISCEFPSGPWSCGSRVSAIRWTKGILWMFSWIGAAWIV